jgi:GR25 family glycosyltransferase involved in LPS biosynthesis
MNSAAPYTGLYINLDRSADRRREIEAELQKHNLVGLYARFAAVDGAREAPTNSKLKPGETGCFLSHYRALLAARDAGTGVHLLEDDAILSSHLGPTARLILGSRIFEQYDILFTDTFLHPNLQEIKNYKELFDTLIPDPANPPASIKFKIFSLAGRGMATTPSYFVGAGAIPRVLDVFQREIAAGLSLPLDLFMRKAVDEGRLRIGCLFPFITSVRLEHILNTTIAARDKQETNPSVLALALLRYSFFVGRDLEGYALPILEKIRRPLAAGRPDPHRAFLLKVLDFYLSDLYRDF